LPSKNFEIAGLSVPPGERGFVRLPVTSLLTGNQLALPLHVLHGSRPGPVLGLTNAIHGSEPMSILILKETLNQIDPSLLQGTILVLPVANPLALARQTRLSPDEEDIDFANLNRVFPGVRERAVFGAGESHPTDRTLTEMIAATISQQILPRLNYVIDFHSGPPAMAIAKMIQKKLGEELGEITRGMCRAFGLGIIHEDEVSPHTSTGYAATLGIASCVVEIGGIGLRSDVEARCVHLGVRGILNVMKYLKMAEGEPEIPERQFVFAVAPHVRPTVAGYLMSQFDREDLFEGDKLGIEVSAGDPLGRVFDPYTFEELEELCSPADGILYFTRRSGLVQAGCHAFAIADLNGARWIT